MRWIVVTVLMVGLLGCAQQRYEDGQASLELDRLRLQAGQFDMDLLRQPTAATKHLRLYIEADLSGWFNGRYQPRKELGYWLFRADRAAYYAVYPCASRWATGCDSSFRGEQRFSTELAEAVGRMLAQLKQQTGGQSLEVVAIGDAAALMLKVAAVSGQIDHLHTINGTLSPTIWARQTGREPPPSSDPLIYHRRLAALAQTHWIAGQLASSQEAMAQAYKKAFPGDNCVRLRVVSDVHSQADWLRLWPGLLNDRFYCAG
ncbi:hypothetical protein [Marinobacterium arenosum]|uniref:hypothetical protein n=1 Tax=Marinobacterium arenosum TaxID=2862496 RepID=UPI001C95F940|nr:hypothetical protein [Marinobacterium arenosum]MBY4676572.1 hypothetical protein [Marinobacterium arenosum]